MLTALAAAHRLSEEFNISAEVVDLRSIRPLDEQTILDSVR
ncbi:MAG: transketolase C-terminal domain-containing protein, partial [Verrucomicrobiota bacterium]